MDTSRKILIGVQCCNNCIRYKPDTKNGYKLCTGKCLLTGLRKKRTDKCGEIIFKGQLKLI